MAFEATTSPDPDALKAAFDEALGASQRLTGVLFGAKMFANNAEACAHSFALTEPEIDTLCASMKRAADLLLKRGAA